MQCAFSPLIMLQNIQCSHFQHDINIYSNAISYTYCYNINTETQAQCNFSGRQDNASSSESSISWYKQYNTYFCSIYRTKINRSFSYIIFYLCVVLCCIIELFLDRKSTLIFFLCFPVSLRYLTIPNYSNRKRSIFIFLIFVSHITGMITYNSLRGCT